MCNESYSFKQHAKLFKITQILNKVERISFLLNFSPFFKLQNFAFVHLLKECMEYRMLAYTMLKCLNDTFLYKSDPNDWTIENDRKYSN